MSQNIALVQFDANKYQLVPKIPTDAQLLDLMLLKDWGPFDPEIGNTDQDVTHEGYVTMLGNLEMPSDVVDLTAAMQATEDPASAVVLSKLFAAADNHGADTGEPDHTVGDLQGLLRKAWNLMTVAQRLQLIQSDEVAELVDLGAQGEYEPYELVAILDPALTLG